MNTYRLLAAIRRTAAIVLGLLTVACGNDDTEEIAPKQSAGTPINFSADCEQTRTVFGELNEQTGIWPINWVKDDQVYITYPGGKSIRYATYTVPDNATGNTRVDLEAMEAEGNGLVWNTDGLQTHSFYAYYPKPNPSKVSIYEHKATLMLPTIQTTLTNGKFNMEYAHMVAATEGCTAPEEGTITNVSLNFQPAVTALEITFTAAETTTLYEIVVSSETQAVAGSYTAAYGNGAWSFTPGDPTTTSKQVVIRFPDGKLSLAAGQQYCVTAFLLAQGYDQLRVDVLTDSGIVGKSSTNTVFEPCKRYRFQLGQLPSSGSSAWRSKSEHWMSLLPDNAYVSDLSIPGSHDAATSTLSSSYQCQTLTIPEQLTAGVRFFDLRPGDNLDIYHSSRSTGIGFDTAIGYLVSFMENRPLEACFVLMQNETAWPSWASEMGKYLNSTSAYRNRFVNYSPDLTLGECRGKILILSRNTYDGNIVGGKIGTWTDNVDYQSTSIANASGVQGTLYIQDKYKLALGQKQTYINALLDVARTTKPTTTWVMNYASYAGLPLSNAKTYNPPTVTYIGNNPGRTGVLYMDAAGDDSSNYYGKSLVTAVINQNQNYTPACK